MGDVTSARDKSMTLQSLGREVYFPPLFAMSKCVNVC